MANVQPSWWRRPLWPWSQLTPWQGFALSALLTALAAYVANRLFNGQQTMVVWLTWLWYVGQGFVKTRHRAKLAAS